MIFHRRNGYGRGFLAKAILLALCLSSSFSLCAEKDGEGKGDTKKNMLAASESLKAGDDAAVKAIEKSGTKESKALWEKALSSYEKAVEIGPDTASFCPAAFGAAMAKYHLGEYWGAFIFIEKSFPKRFEAKEVSRRLEMESIIAKELMAKGGAVVDGAQEGKKKLSGYAAASRVFKAIVYNDPRSSSAPQALLLQGDCHLRAGEFEEAEKAYRDIEKFMGKTEQAILAKASLAEALAAMPRKGGMTQDVSLEIEQLIADVEIYRDDSKELARRIDAAESAKQEAFAGDLLKKSKYHFSRRTKRDRNAGIFLLEDILKRFPKAPSAVEAKELLDGLGVETGDKKE
ncbi:MAG: tetratricopeptide repeat protein [Planctomycetes bacterium]|nr:tetratricopeptide repeat protein [Planctomycetota bacterium]